ncbi:MAG: WbuC family cupin fold metalloprotein [Lachnospiraceae bacterium]|nr:WbuC family cupin fold metalloprotein [Lachnospiraceae bacterium]
MEGTVQFMQGDVIKVKMEQIEELKDITKRRGVRSRLCMQDSPENCMQDMYICRKKGDYCRPDKHRDIPESHVIIDGTEAIVLFSDTGEIIDAFILDRENGYLTYRINSAMYHMTIPLSEYAVDLEIKPGPFDDKTNIYPEWAPHNTDHDGIRKFMEKVNQKIKILKSENCAKEM